MRRQSISRDARRRVLRRAFISIEPLESRVLLSGDGTIGEYNASTGAPIDASLISGLSNPTGIAVSGSDLFVANTGTGTIGEYTTSGRTVNASLISGLPYIRGVAVSGSELFVATWDGSSSPGMIGEYTISDGQVVASNPSLISGPFVNSGGIAVAGSDLFVAEYGNGFAPTGTIAEYSTSGALVNSSLISGLMDPGGISVSGTDLYVVNEVNDMNNQGLFPIGEYDITTGQAINASFLTGLNSPTGTAEFGGDLLVGDLNDGTIGEFDAESGAAVNDHPLVEGLVVPYAIAVSGSDIFVTNSSGVSAAPNISFGTDGTVTTSVTAVRTYVQSDGDPIVVGSTSSSGFALEGFPTSGTSPIFSSTAPLEGNVTGVSEDSNGNLLLVGDDITRSGRTHLAFARFTSSGALDATFGSGGTALGPAISTDGGKLIFDDAVQSDGKILVIDQLGANFSLTRYNTDLSLDTSFGTDGNVMLRFSRHFSSIANAITLQSNGQIIVAGISGSDIALSRHNTNGTLDTSFGSRGVMTTPLAGLTNVTDVKVTGSGQIEVLGYTGSGENITIAIARYNSNGILDSTFGVGGIALSGVGSATATLVVHPTASAKGIATPFRKTVTAATSLALDAVGDTFEATLTYLTELLGISRTTTTTAEIFGFTFVSAGGNAVPTPSSTPLSDVAFILEKYKGRTLITSGAQQVTTNAHGQFVFAGIAPGTYRLTQATATGYKLVSPKNGYDVVSIVVGQQSGFFFADASTAQSQNDIARATPMFATEPLMSDDLFDDSGSGFFATRESDQAW